MRPRPRPVSAAATAATLAALLAGCGSAVRHHQPATARPAHPPVVSLPAPGPTGVAPSADAIGVIRGWSTALRDGRLDDAAAYFALPSSFINGGGPGLVSVVTIRTHRQARLVNASLPCGATLISADQRGRYVNALFRLGGRAGVGGSDCGGGTGQTARTNFVIHGGKILEWIRAPDDPGDNGGGGAPGGAPSPVPTPAPGNQPTPVV